jgi:hypothetical protein
LDGQFASGNLTAAAGSDVGVAVQALLGSRAVFYPGSAFDGQPVMHFNSAHAAHAYIYADYGIEQGDMGAALQTMQFKGCDLVRKVILNENDMGATGWKPHIESVQRRFASAQAYGFISVFKRQNGFGPEHGADHFAVLFLGADGIATYDALYCQENGRTPPFSIVLQDHSFGGNWTSFGRGGAFEALAKKTNRFPQYLLIGTADEWDGFADVHLLGEKPDNLVAGHRENWRLFARPQG